MSEDKDDALARAAQALVDWANEAAADPGRRRAIGGPLPPDGEPEEPDGDL